MIAPPPLPSSDLALRRLRVADRHRCETLLDVSRTFAATEELPTALHRVLGLIERHHDAVRAAFLFRDPDAGGEELRIEAGVGISADGLRARYRPGEGIVGRVMQSGKPIVVPDVTREPLFLNRASRRRNRHGKALSFVCVPVTYGRAPIGVLGVELERRADGDCEELVRFLELVAAMTAQAVKAVRLAELERRRLLDEHAMLERTGQQGLSNLVGSSGPMRQVYEQVARVARTSTTVLVRGESGTGKELIAQAIHDGSDRARKPFVCVNCAALPASLIESELFGYEPGAFTGARTRKKGRFELADGGTLFLDEIGDIDVATQVKLLRVLQEREFERLGGTETIKVNVRVIAATNKNLERAIEERAFREDLYYRLNVFAVFVPPLRERKTDVMPLADCFLSKYARAHGKSIERISTPAIDMLVSYHWPGNVRELENTIERAVLVCDSNVIHGHHLPPTLQTAEATGTIVTVALADAVAKLERELIQDALKTARGNRAKAARLLGSTERVVSYKIRKYGVDCTRFR